MSECISFSFLYSFIFSINSLNASFIFFKEKEKKRKRYTTAANEIERLSIYAGVIRFTSLCQLIVDTGLRLLVCKIPVAGFSDS